MTEQRESGAHGRVLIVDDQKDAAALIALVLVEEGYDVKVAHDGLQAMALAIEFKPQIALLDIGLPTVNGYQLAALLQAEPGLQNCRLIAMSGHCSSQDRARSSAAGFDLHLGKPLSLEALLLAILPRKGTESASGALVR